MERDERMNNTDTIRFSIVATDLGPLLAAASDKGLCAVFMDDDREEMKRELKRRFRHSIIREGGAEKIAARVARLIKSPLPVYDGPLDLRGTKLQRAVWNALRKIPAGQTTTYTKIAEKIGRPDAVRAVGTACGANHVSLVVPCHRVVRRDGALAGYRWGLARKEKLIRWEREAMEQKKKR